MADNPQLEVSMGNTGGFAIDMGDPDAEVQKYSGKPVSVDTADKPVGSADGDDPAKKQPNAGEPGDEGSDPQDGADGDEGADGDDPVAPEDLGEFKAEDAEKWDAQYVKDGALDVHGALTAEFFANAKAGKEGLNEGTYAYLESKGISRATVKDIEAMAATAQAGKETDAKNLAKEHDMAMFTEAGGPDKLQAALKWAREGGYDEAGRKRFNDITAGADLDAKLDAVNALMARHARAAPSKPGLPARDATKGRGQGSGAVEGYATRADYRKALREAEGNPAKSREVAKRLAASKF